MKGEINLLPPEAQHDRVRRLYLVHWRQLTRTALLLGVVFLAGQFGILLFYYSLARAGALAEEPMIAGRNVQREIAEHNQLLKVVEARAQAQVVWSARLGEVLAAVREPVTVQELTVDATGEALTVRGAAPASRAVVDMQQALEKLPWVKRIDAPLKNFAVGPDATFTLTLYPH